MTTTTPTRDFQRYVTVKRIVELPPYACWLTEQSLRHLIFEASPRLDSQGHEIPSNGLARAIIRIGRKVIIDRVEFDSWIQRHRMNTNLDSGGY